MGINIYGVDDEKRELLTSLVNAMYAMWEILGKCRRVVVVTEPNKVEAYDVLLTRMASVLTELQLNNAAVVHCIKRDLWSTLTQSPWNADGVVFLRARKASRVSEVMVERGNADTVGRELMHVGPCALVTVKATTVDQVAEMRLEWWYAALREDLLADLQTKGINLALRKRM